MIHHDADGDDDGTYEKFEININDPEGPEKLQTENDLITGTLIIVRSAVRSPNGYTDTLQKNSQ